jgi:hypothetical protein
MCGGAALACLPAGSSRILDDQTSDRSGAAPVADQDAQQADPPHPEPYLSNRGPLDGPILGHDTPGAIGVLVDGEAMPIGIAYPVGLVEHRSGPVTTFRLVVDETELPARWLDIGRRFVQLGKAAEEL